MTRRMIRTFVVGIGALALLLVTPVSGAGEEPSSAQGLETTETIETTEEKTQEEVTRRLEERRRAMMEEAQDALDRTHVALEALDEDKREEALEALARATGKLELIVARDPDLALAPVDVHVVTHDVYATPDAIEAAREEAESLLADGKVQEARALLAGLASEIVIQVTNLPLATYPDAIKEISPLIDEGEIEEAKAGLRAALGTMVLTDRVIPLPLLRAQYLLEEAGELAGKEEPTDEETERARELVSRAREQIRMAELLGYGEEEQHGEFRKQVADLEKSIRGGDDTEGVFARVRSSLAELQESFFD